MDIVVDSHIVIEIKAVEKILPIHEAQLLTYLRLSGYPLGLLLNFNAPMLKDGIRRRRL
jgi:GxxExxY protein